MVSFDQISFRPIPKWPLEAATPHYPFLPTPPFRVVVKSADLGAFICETPYQSVEVKGPNDLRFDLGVFA